MSENGGAASSQGTDELAVPSVKEILDGVAHEAGLSRLDDDVFKSGIILSDSVLCYTSPMNHMHVGTEIGFRPV